MRIGAGAKHSVHKHCQHHRPIWQCMTLCVSIKEEYLMCFCSIVQRAVEAVDVLGSSHLCITQLSAQGEGEYYSPHCTNCANRNMALNCRLFSGGTAMLDYTAVSLRVVYVWRLSNDSIKSQSWLVVQNDPPKRVSGETTRYLSLVWGHILCATLVCHTVGPHIVCSTLDTVV